MKNIISTFLIVFVTFLSNAGIISNPIVPNLSDLSKCDQNNNITEVFDLTVQTEIILSAQTSPTSEYVVTYHTTIVDASSGVNPIQNANAYIASNQEAIYVRIENNSTQEYNIGVFNLLVNTPSTPLFSFDTSLCLNSVPPSLATTSTNGIEGTWLPSTINTTVPGTYMFTFTPNSGQCSSALTIAVSIASTSTPTLTLLTSPPTTNQTICFGQPIVNVKYQLDGASGASVTALPTGITAVVTASILTISGTSTIPGNFNYSIVTSGGCETIVVQGNINIIPFPVIETDNEQINVICVDYSTNNVLNPFVLEATSFNSSENHTYQWYKDGVAILGATNAYYTIDSPLSNALNAIYTVEYTDVTAMGCNGLSSDFQVVQSGPANPIGIGYSIINNSGVQTLTVEVEGYGDYKYQLDSQPQQSSNIFSNVSLGTHTIKVWDTKGVAPYNCNSLVISNIEVSLTTTPPPTGNSSQSFGAGATLANIQLNGQNIQWYSGANQGDSKLPMNTPLINGTTYYASQKIGGYESASRTSVSVQVSLSNPDFEVSGLYYAPNPVFSILNIKSNQIIDEVNIYNLLGQVVYNIKTWNSDLQVDLSSLNSGNYLVKVNSGTSSSIFKIIKE